MSSPDPRRALSQGAEAVGCPLDEEQAERLLAFLALLAKWNRVYNLTAVRDTERMLDLHLLDSLAIVPSVRRHLDQGPPPAEGWRLLDVGSGAGLPGAVLAIMEPRLQVHCIDAVGKKARFVQQVAVELGLERLHSIHGRVETLESVPYGLITSRAFATLGDFVRMTYRLAGPDTVWLAMKGKRPDEEMARLPADVEVFHVEPLDIVSLGAERCLVWMRPKVRA